MASSSSKGAATCRQAVVGKLESDTSLLSPLSQEMFGKLVDEFSVLENQLAYYQEKLETLANTHPEYPRLMTIPGMSPTALVAALREARVFKKRCRLVAWWGLGPRLHATGGKAPLIGISQRGDSSLCKLLGYGTQAVVRVVGAPPDCHSRGIRERMVRRGVNRATGAVTNQHARVVWALLTSH